uniref:Exostosin GT47 domain-containing protein n=1 Tax=Chromera velia CCMP2878 TaxID=1169474 RepID=A0A0G4HRG2_9ALVE|eukprot:Cvel_30605.t1-p1 / transcript=Cvel_30605.t1 / gene=Cvel_30605 / organism=Chromera_velia_CCMP2878 / gene_product=hypothetical protein / transcript_product=hypothetical protein / location=Cvel_scaffold4390:345-1058(-) / protein_length=238 / sequence_SO=supercontig / SO=protein_coding / is_pseudo=false
MCWNGYEVLEYGVMGDYSLETLFIGALQDRDFLTTDPSTAKVFVVPQFSIIDLHLCYSDGIPKSKGCPVTPEGQPVLEVYEIYYENVFKPLLDALEARPTWKRHGGRDHLFVFPYDYGWNVHPEIPERLSHSLFVGYQGPEYNAVIVPCTIGRQWHLDGNNGGSFSRFSQPLTRQCQKQQAKYLAYFAGTVLKDWAYSHGVRQALFEMFGNGQDPRILVSIRRLGFSLRERERERESE